ncbi:hypothetical protein AAH446_11990 [Erwinia sp. P6884]|uniref:hypothetical protein n=1 Tax=Erwinia sp. P6884 TaxID=3141450 RepID=UPI003192DD79
MREINQTEIAAVSGAGLTEFRGNVNTALAQVSAKFDTTLDALAETSVIGEKIGLSYKAFGLSIVQGYLSSFSNFLTKLAA